MFPEIVLRHVWDHTSRCVAYESRGQYGFSSSERQAAKSGCEQACRLQYGELEHFCRQLVQLRNRSLRRHIYRAIERQKIL